MRPAAAVFVRIASRLLRSRRSAERSGETPRDFANLRGHQMRSETWTGLVRARGIAPIEEDERRGTCTCSQLELEPKVSTRVPQLLRGR